ncbi:MAG TPA: VacJ family lipoprotein [Rhodospirillales bacterium]|nr:VacJ family lipoprotein [Rhodospirillales bacterium]
MVGNASFSVAANITEVEGTNAYIAPSDKAVVANKIAADKVVADELAADEVAAEASGADEDFNDPIEPLNRAIFGFNEFLQDILFRPIVTVYNFLPAGVRDAVANILHNLNTPVILANDLLQFEFDRAGQTLGRFMVNTIAGAGGIADVASDLGIEKHGEDFGQTLGAWGVGEGLYIVLPIFGPSNPRDFAGLLVDNFFDPLSTVYVDDKAVTWSLAGAKGVSQYAAVVEELDQIKSTSIDYYAAIRSMYRQKRNAKISNGQEIDLPPIPDFDLSFQQHLDEENKEVSSASAE